jgi:hypothetical protein
MADALAQQARPAAKAPQKARPKAKAKAKPAAPAPPQYVSIFTGDEDSVAVFDLSTKVRTKDVVSVKRLLLLADPVADDDGTQYQWVENVVEYDCNAHKLRQRLVRYLTPDRSGEKAAPNTEFVEWQSAEPGTAGRLAEDYVCRAVPDSRVSQVADLDTLRQKVQAGRKPKPPPPGVTAYYTSPIPATLDQTALFDVATRKIEGEHVLVTEWLLRAKPLREDYYWVEATAEVDCRNNRIRTQPRTLWRLDRKGSSPLPDPTFQEWVTVRPRSANAKLQTFLCLGDGDPAIKKVDDVLAFQRSFFEAVGAGGS